MKIQFDKNTVNLIPETDVELVKVNALWRALIDCNGPALSISPIGEFTPTKGSAANFVIENFEAQPFFSIPLLEDSEVYCDTCNKLLSLKKGDTIPPCCGKLMEIVE